jgi:hypothetical protein
MLGEGTDEKCCCLRREPPDHPHPRSRWQSAGSDSEVWGRDGWLLPGA